VMIERSAVDEAFLNSGNWEVDIAGRSYPAIVSAKPLYDRNRSASTRK